MNTCSCIERACIVYDTHTSQLMWVYLLTQGVPNVPSAYQYDGNLQHDGSHPRKTLYQ